MLFLQHHRLLPTWFPAIPIPFRAKAKHPIKKHSGMQIYGNWFKSMKRNVVWLREEGTEQKIAFNGGGGVKADKHQDFFLLRQEFFSKDGPVPNKSLLLSRPQVRVSASPWDPEQGRRLLSARSGSPTEQRHKPTNQHTPSATLIPNRQGSQNPTFPWRTATPVHPWV